MSVKGISYTGIFVAMMVAGAYIKVPFYPVPLTFQLAFCALAALLLGVKYGTISQLCYLILGLIGLPVFSQGGGIGYVFKPTFGFIIGFVACALVIGVLTRRIKKVNFAKLYVCVASGMVIQYIIGSVYFYFIMNFYLKNVKSIMDTLKIAVFPFILKDLALGLFVVYLAMTLIPILSWKNKKGYQTEDQKSSRW